MKENNSLIIKKESWIKNIINKIKKVFFKNEKKDILTEKTRNITIDEKSEHYRKETFFKNIKAEIDTSIYALKIKLDNGEIKAIDLTDEQINKLQQLYDKEINEKKQRIKVLKQSA